MKRILSILCVALSLLLALPALAEGFDVSLYSYEELLTIRETVNETISAMERQYAIENGNRVISFAEESLLLFKGKTQKLEPSVRRVVEEAPEKTSFVYTTSDAEIAKVSKDGVVTAVGYGDCIITCTAADDEFIFCELPVHVALKVSAVELSGDSAELLLKQDEPALAQISLSAAVQPENAHVQTVRWESSDETIATVDANGNVQALAPGSVTITALSDDDPGKDSNGKQKRPVSASCKLTVKQAGRPA